MINSELFPNGRWLLCNPVHFDVRYEINPWMKLSITPERARARQQWTQLHHLLIRLGVWIDYVEPHPAQPDMVYTANAGLVHGQSVVLSAFKHAERRGEEAWFQAWFEQAGYKVLIPKVGSFEGEGDALFAGDILFCGYGFRTERSAVDEVAQLLNVKQVVACELVSPYFYHLDTCFCPINTKQALIYKAAFTPESIQRMEQVIDLIEVPEQDAKHFACNSVVLGKDIVVPAGCTETCAKLTSLGFTPYQTELSEFLKGGGAAKCLSLNLKRPSTFLGA